MVDNLEDSCEKNEDKYENQICSVILIEEQKPFVDIEKFTSILVEQYQVNQDCIKEMKIELGNNGLRFVMEDLRCKITLINSSYKNHDFENSCNNAYHWKDALSQLTGSTQHYLISVDNKVLELRRGNIILQNHIFLTKVVAALAEVTEAQGVYWKASMIVNKSSEFIKIVKDRIPNAMPIELWIDFCIERSMKNKHSLFTRGLASFSKKENEIWERAQTSYELAIFTYNLVYYLIKDNIILRHGIKITDDNGEIMTFEEENSVFEKNKRVLVLKWK